MKKYLILALFVLSGYVVRADYRETPHGPPGALATADYGGVFVATSAFSVSNATACNNCSGLYYAVGFSSGAYSSNDFVDVFDATSASMAITNNTLIDRVYNISGSSAQVSNAGWFGPPKPIRFFQGLSFKPSNANYNSIRLLYYKQP